MPLRFDLGVGERLYVGRGVITNGRTRSMFILEGDIPVLKEKDVISRRTPPPPLSVSMSTSKNPICMNSRQRRPGIPLLLRRPRRNHPTFFEISRISVC